jgi:hypothetical protein
VGGRRKKKDKKQKEKKRMISMPYLHHSNEQVVQGRIHNAPGGTILIKQVAPIQFTSFGRLLISPMSNNQVHYWHCYYSLASVLICFS